MRRENFVTGEGHTSVSPSTGDACRRTRYPGITTGVSSFRCLIRTIILLYLLWPSSLPAVPCSAPKSIPATFLGVATMPMPDLGHPAERLGRLLLLSHAVCREPGRFVRQVSIRCQDCCARYGLTGKLAATQAIVRTDRPSKANYCS